MKKTTVFTAAGLSILSGAAFAGGIDRTNTPIDIIFKEGNYAEVAYGQVIPSIKGKDLTGTKTGNISKDYGAAVGGVKMQVNEKLSFSMIFDTPYGSHIDYKDSSPLLGGTYTKASSKGITVLMRYSPTERFSIYGGPRVVRAKGRIELGGLAFGPANGYKVKLGEDTGLGFVAGAAYEIPDMALRVALTYHSKTKLTFDTTETLPVPGLPGGLKLKTGNTKSKTPQSIELKAQTGIAANTLLFGSVRWSEWSKFKVRPTVIDTDLVNIRDVWSFSLGAGRKFTDKLSGSLTLGYEPKRKNDSVSPLLPTNGRYTASLGASYDINDRVNVAGSVTYYVVGNAKANVGGTDVAKFKNNDAVSVGMKVGYKF